jgi:hypothetical protein
VLFWIGIDYFDENSTISALKYASTSIAGKNPKVLVRFFKRQM